MVLLRIYSIVINLLLVSTLANFNIRENIPMKSEAVPVANIIEEDYPIEEEKKYIREVAYKYQPIEKPKEDLTPIVPEVFNTTLLEYSLQYNNQTVKEIHPNPTQVFPEKYTDMEGVITFRGNNLRNAPSYGISNIKDEKLQKIWEFTTGRSSWGGGAGWTGQPVIVRWSEKMKAMMNLEEEFKEKDGFTEVIYGSLGGSIYFLELNTGKPSRSPIPIKNPIKGSVAIDPREYPLLYIGDGINESGKFGYRIFSLIDSKELYFIKGNDPFAYRGWGAFDSCSIVSPYADTLIVAGENGLFYNIDLNTNFHRENKEITIDPKIIKYRYKIKGNAHQGIENSTAVYKNLAFFADNGGSIQCVNLTNMKPVWALEKSDDTDATITIDVEDGIPYLYTGTEVDKQGTKGNAIIKKINGITGETVWKKNYECQSILGERPVNGGILATNVVGKNDISNMVIFTIARYKTINSGLMVALDKTTGDEIWTWEMPNYVWSSPVDFYNADGKGYIIQCDSIGNMYLLDGITGKILNKINLGSNIESSPAVFEDYIVVGTRGGNIVGVKIK